MTIKEYRYRNRLRTIAMIMALPFAVPMFGVISILAVAVRIFERGTRHKKNTRPRLIYGPVPIISFKYMRQAMERKGFFARTLVYDVYSIHSHGDFDFVLDEMFGLQWLKGWGKKILALILGRYVAFCWLLFRFDVFHFVFDGGFLSTTPLQFLEVQMLHLAGKKVVVMPYGSDVAMPSHMRSLAWRHGLMAHYPHLGFRERQVRRRLEYFSDRADFIVACMFHLETLPRWDLLTTLYYPIDTEAWAPPASQQCHNGRDGEVVVVHAPNHRVIKGTEFLVDACNELRSDGLLVRLQMLEGIPNSDVRGIMQKADIVADQFVNAYALTAVEAMSMGKPVLANLADDAYCGINRMYTGLNECPIVSTTTQQIKENLRKLICDPALRARLGEEGRRYVVKYHSYSAMGRMWEVVYRRVWGNEEIELSAWHPDKFRDDGKGVSL